MTSNTIACRLATAVDAAVVAELFYLCDLHYWGDKAPSREAMKTHVRDRVLTASATIEVLLAEKAGRAVGFASFSVLYPAPDLGGQLYLKDLFVPEEARSGGVGLTLMRALAVLAMERGCQRLDWTAEDYNPRALAFYDGIGARRVEEKIYYRFDGDALKNFAAGD